MYRRLAQRSCTLLQFSFLVALAVGISSVRRANADAIWTGAGGDGLFSNNANWDGGGDTPGTGINIDLGDAGTLLSPDTHSLDMNVNGNPYGSFLVTGIDTYTLDLIEELKSAGQIGSTGSGVLNLTTTNGKNFNAQAGTSFVGTINADLGTKEFKFEGDTTGIGGGGTVNIISAAKIKAKSDFGITAEMDFTLDISEPSIELEIKKGTGAGANGVIYFKDMRLHDGVDLTMKMEQQTDAKLNLTLDGDVDIIVNSKNTPTPELLIGQVDAADGTTLTIDINHSGGSTTLATFVGELNPGNSPGTLNLQVTTDGAASTNNDVLLAATASYRFEIGPTSSDLINVFGDLTVADGFAIELVGLTGASSGTYDLFTYDGTYTGDASTWNVTNPDGLLQFNFINDSLANVIQISVTAQSSSASVPEPATIMPVLICGVALLARRRRAGPRLKPLRCA